MAEPEFGPKKASSWSECWTITLLYSMVFHSVMEKQIFKKERANPIPKWEVKCKENNKSIRTSRRLGVSFLWYSYLQLILNICPWWQRKSFAIRQRLSVSYLFRNYRKMFILFSDDLLLHFFFHLKEQHCRYTNVYWMLSVPVFKSSL